MNRRVYHTLPNVFNTLCLEAAFGVFEGKGKHIAFSKSKKVVLLLQSTVHEKCIYLSDDVFQNQVEIPA